MIDPQAYPRWLTRSDKGVMIIDPSIAYPHILRLLEIEPAQYDQYWLECAFQIAKLAAQEASPPAEGYALAIEILPDDTYRLANYPRGRGADKATRGLEARQHYARIKDRVLAMA